MDNSTERNYDGLTEIAAILTGNHPQAVEDMSLLVWDRDAFIAARPGWWEEMFDDEYDHNDALFRKANINRYDDRLIVDQCTFIG